MSSKGTPIITLRLKDADRDAICVAVRKRNLYRIRRLLKQGQRVGLSRVRELWCLADFIRIAIAEKLSKMERSRTYRGRGRARGQDTIAASTG